MKGELSTREVQLASLEVLKKIDEICTQEGIRYWVMYGTLIGAIRHHGFIPWDDDLDIAMPRPDYERFLAWCRDHADEMRPLVALDGYRQGLPFLITRISDTTYKMVGEFSSAAPELGAFVDVYPIDGCGNTQAEAFRTKAKCFRALSTFNKAMNYHQLDDFSWKNPLRDIRSFLLGSPSRHAEHLQAKCMEHSYEASKYVSCPLWQSSNAVWPRSQCDEIVYADFEDLKVPIPSGYNCLLTVIYGDYMKLPPEEERIGHHYYSVVKRQ